MDNEIVSLAVAELIADATDPQEKAVLVAGQALAFWASFYDLRYESGVNPLASKDVDFIESKKGKVEGHIESLRGHLQKLGFQISETHWSSPDGATPEVAKLIMLCVLQKALG